MQVAAKQVGNRNQPSSSATPKASFLNRFVRTVTGKSNVKLDKPDSYSLSSTRKLENDIWILLNRNATSPDPTDSIENV